VKEPFASLFTQGMVTHETYRTGDGSWLSPGEVRKDGDDWVAIADGQPVTVGRVEKMSKSKKNVVDPDAMVERFGADAVRWFMLSDSPPERDLPWSESGIEGCARFVHRLWRLFAQRGAGGAGADAIEDRTLDRKVHHTVAAVAEDIEALAFNKAVARIYELTNAVEKAPYSASRSNAISTLLSLVAPMMPHLAEEARSNFNIGMGLVADESWPKVDPALLVEDEVTVAVQVKGKLRDTLNVARGLSNQELEALALASEKVQRALDGAEVRKVIVVPDRLVNIVA
jgi:leucyl-tRNA synthetase